MLSHIVGAQCLTDTMITVMSLLLKRRVVEQGTLAAPEKFME